MSFINLNLKDADIAYFPEFFTESESAGYFDKIATETPWRQDDIQLFGKKYKQPRLTALYGDNKKAYSYSGIIMHPLEFTPTLLKIKNRIEDRLNLGFTSCLLNLYRDGQDSNGWHADDEKELGKNPVIASVSFGQERIFHLKHKTDRDLKYKIVLKNGSLLLMKGTTQHYWLHQLPKTKKKIKQRINLTFRYIK